MRASVIIRSKDEADRLRLTLTSLAMQSVTPEIIVVNDGSTDHTAEVLDAAAEKMSLIRLDHARPLGRPVATNAGAARASGDILIFLDGDTLAAPDFVVDHIEAHRGAPRLVARGETYHLRGTRFFLDPETGSPRPGEEARVARFSASELARMRVTMRDILENFGIIDERAQPGIYPGAGPRLLFDREMAALRDEPESDVLWAAASGSNMSVDRREFLAAGGLNEALDHNDHREIALRLCRSGHRMVPVKARSYHLTHRTGWRDPLGDTAWEQILYRAHPIPEVPLLRIFWASLSDPAPFPTESLILSLADLARAAKNCAGTIGIEEVRAAHFAATRQAASRGQAG
jgi:glycosyltransferase involved in cell wall biosynthesis